jgi:thiol-disulfide isomerase/thioredoxin
MTRTSRPARAVLAACGLLLLSAVGCRSGGGRDGDVAERVLVAANRRTAAPALTGQTLEGETFDLLRLRGQVVVINVWGSWCAPCKKEQPDLVRAAADLAGERVAFLGINVRDKRASALAHNRRYAVTYPSLHDEGFRLVSRFKGIGPQAVPSTILVDRKGRIAAVLFGSTDHAELTSLAGRLAAEPA